MMLSYGYHVKVGEERYLALGISAGMVSRKFGGDLITGMPEIDPEILEMLAGRSVFRPDVNLGLTFMAPKFSFGFSATHLTRYVMKDDDWFKPPLHLYAFMDFGLDFNENVRLIPRIQAVSAMNWAAALPADSTLATKFMDKMDIALDFGATLFVKDKFWIGASFRSGLPFAGTSLSAMVGINVAPNVRVGYSYDYKLGNTFQNIKTYGSHEIMLNYRMRISETEMSENTPRFFD
jgi:type IX secretion system PorP/SprF family membrane protein